jgi:hypothetical protein
VGVDFDITSDSDQQIAIRVQNSHRCWIEPCFVSLFPISCQPREKGESTVQHGLGIWDHSGGQQAP